MEDATPSRTALGVARMRALHQFSPQAGLFRDSYAIAILGEAAPTAQELEQEDERRRRMRLFVSARPVRRGLAGGGGSSRRSATRRAWRRPRHVFAAQSVSGSQRVRSRPPGDAGLETQMHCQCWSCRTIRHNIRAGRFRAAEPVSGIGRGRFAVDRTELLHLAGGRPLPDEGSDLQDAVLDSRYSWLGGGVRLQRTGREPRCGGPGCPGFSRGTRCRCRGAMDQLLRSR